jgi:hypothetical protein
MPTLQPNPPSGPAPLAGYRHFVIGFMAYLFLCQCGVLFRSIPTALAGFADFRSFYTAGFMVRSGYAHQLYDYHLQERLQNLVAPQNSGLPFIYPAYASLLFVPLSFLSYRAAYLLFLAMNLLLLWLSARLMRDSLPHLAGLWPPLPSALFFCFFPVAVALMQGQTSILLLALYCAAFASLQKGKPLQAGIFLGLAILKFQIALPVALLFLLWRRWRFVAGFAAGAAAATALSLCVTGYPAFLEYWRTLFLMASSASGRTAQFCMSPAMMPNLNGLAQLISGGAAWGARLGAVAAILLFLWIASRPYSPAMALVTALLISRYMGIHDLVLLLLPVAIALDHALANPSEPGVRTRAMICGVLLFPPAYLFLMGRSLINAFALAILAFLISLSLPGCAPRSAEEVPAAEALPSR